MDRKGYLVTLVMPQNANMEFLKKISNGMSSQQGFLAINIDSEHNYLHFVFDTPESAKQARINALNLMIAVLGGDIQEVIFDDTILSDEYQNELKNNAKLQMLQTAVELEKLKHEGKIPPS